MQTIATYLFFAAAILASASADSAPRKDEAAPADTSPNVFVIQQKAQQDLPQEQDAADTEAYLIPLQLQELPTDSNGKIDGKRIAEEKCGRGENLAMKLKLEPMNPQEAAQFLTEAEQDDGGDVKGAKQPSWGFYFGSGRDGFGRYYGYDRYGYYGRGYGPYYGWSPYDRPGRWGYRNRGVFWPFRLLHHVFTKTASETLICSVYVKEQSLR